MAWPKGKPRKEHAESTPVEVQPKVVAKKRTRPVTREMVQGLVEMTNFFVAFVPALQGDALDNVEAALLIDALYTGAKSNRYIANMIHALTTVNANGKTFITIGAIGARRLARHDMLPRDVDAQAGQLLELIAMTRTEPTKRGRPKKAEMQAEVYTDDNAVVTRPLYNEDTDGDDGESMELQADLISEEVVQTKRRAKRGS